MRDGAPSAEDDAPSCPESEASQSYVTIRNGDALDELRKIPDASIDAIVTDPPYELGFMGKKWDGSGIAYSVELWREALRVLKPGGHLVAFGGTRTYHRMACAVEDAGFEIRDSLTWLYGSGFPKSLDVGKAIDKAAGAQREVIGINPRAAQQTPKRGTASYGEYGGTSSDLTAPATDAARQWQGWGTALKPAQEPIVLARRPPSGTVAANVLAHGTGALNIDSTRTAGAPTTGGGGWAAHKVESTEGWDRPYANGVSGTQPNASGRWPANVLLSHGPDCADVCTPGCPVAELDAQTPNLSTQDPATRKGSRARSELFGNRTPGENYADDKPGASRFFPVFRYQAKAPAKERPKVAVPPKLRLRSDLTDEQRAHVLAELTKAGVDVA